MGNVLASSVPSPVIEPAPSPNLPDPSAGVSKDLPTSQDSNPGTVEDLHKTCKGDSFFTFPILKIAYVELISSK